MSTSLVCIHFLGEKVWIPLSAARKSKALEHLLIPDEPVDLSELEQIITAEGLVNVGLYLQNQPIRMDKKTAFNTLVAATALGIPELVKDLETIYSRLPRFSHLVLPGKATEAADWSLKSSDGFLLKESESNYVLDALQIEALPQGI